MQSTMKNWIEQARMLRGQADDLPVGPEREELLRQAYQLDQAIEMTNLLSVKGSRKYR